MPKAQQVEFLLAGVRDTNGNPLSAGLVYSYSAGTTNAKALYSASDKSTSHAQGVALDGYGRLQAWGDGAYKIVIKTSAGVTLYTFDNVLYGYDDGELKWGATSTGSANTQAVSISSVTSLVDGLRVIFIAGYSNSGAMTLNVSSLGAVAIKKLDGTTALAANDILAGDIVDVIYDSGAGGHFRVLFPNLNRVANYAGTSGGSANAQTITPIPTISAYASGQRFQFLAGFSNTGATTINVAGLGVKTIKRLDGTTDLVANDIVVGDMVDIEYESGVGVFRLLSPTFNRRALFCGTSGGTANALTMTANPVVTALAIGQEYSFVASLTNTAAAPTLNLSGLGAYTIYRQDGRTAEIGDIYINQIHKVIWLGGSWTLLNPACLTNTYTPTLGVSAGALSATSSSGTFSKRIGGWIDFSLTFTATLSVAAAYLTATLPETLSNIYQCVLVTGYSMGYALPISTTVLQIYRYDNSNWPNTAVTVIITGSYQSAS